MAKEWILNNMMGLLSLPISLYVFYKSQKQLHFATMSRCIDIYREKYSSLSCDSEKKQCIEFVDFINEELFYLENRFVPDKVAMEWIDGMIDLVPIIINDKIINKHICLQKILEDNTFEKYRRVKNAFNLKGGINCDYVYSYSYSKVFYTQRKVLCEIIYKKIKKYRSV